MSHLPRPTATVVPEPIAMLPICAPVDTSIITMPGMENVPKTTKAIC